MRDTTDSWQRMKCVGLLLVCLTLVGCGGYRLQGIVLDGPRPGIYIVEPDDPRLSELGIADATIELTLDPVSLRPRSLGKAVAKSDGTFDVPIDAAGVGFLEYDISLYVRSRGFAPVDSGPMALPPNGKRLLIVMGAGEDRPRRNENLLEESRRESERWKVN